MTERKKNGGRRVPQMRLHKQSGRGYVRLSKQVFWCGVFGSPEALEECARQIRAWEARGCRPLEESDEPPTVGELADGYRAHLAETRSDAWWKNNSDRIEGGLRPLVELFGTEWADEFGPRKLGTLIAAMAQPGKLSAASLRARLDHVRRAFRWAAATERVPASVWHAVQSVPNPRVGEFGLRGSKKRKPVSEEAVFAILPELNPVVRAIVELLWWTGARPGEIRGLRPCDIDRDGAVWAATLEQHKNVNRGKSRTIVFGPHAQEVLRPFLDRVPRPTPDAPLFSPQLALELHRNEKRTHRKTPLWPSHVARYARERSQREEQQVGELYTARSLGRAVERAQERVNAARKERGEEPFLRWTLYCIRHAVLSRIRRTEGLEAAKTFAGHSGVTMTTGYTTEAERDHAIHLAAKLG